jgi:hypothetical protein
MKAKLPKIEAAKDKAAKKPGKSSRRGTGFSGVHSGVMMGMGSDRPVALRNKGIEGVLEDLKNRRGVRWIAGYHGRRFLLYSLLSVLIYVSEALEIWAPSLSCKYKSTMNTVFSRFPQLKRNFRNAFGVITFNFGKSVRTFKH